VFTNVSEVCTASIIRVIIATIQKTAIFKVTAVKTSSHTYFAAVLTYNFSKRNKNVARPKCSGPVIRTSDSFGDISWTDLAYEICIVPFEGALPIFA
jgi:hypothetical protein